MKNNMVKDLSILTTIPEKSLGKFYKKMILTICDTITEYIKDPDYEPSKIMDIDIGIGTLYIKRIGDTTKYHFKPNDIMDQYVEDTFANPNNVLQDFLSETLAKKFIDVYKDLC